MDRLLHPRRQTLPLPNAAREREQAIRTQKGKVDKQLATATRKLGRVANGVCSECNRSFCNLSRHMERVHERKVDLT